MKGGLERANLPCASYYCLAAQGGALAPKAPPLDTPLQSAALTIICMHMVCYCMQEMKLGQTLVDTAVLVATYIPVYLWATGLHAWPAVDPAHMHTCGHHCDQSPLLLFPQIH